MKFLKLYIADCFGSTKILNRYGWLQRITYAEDGAKDNAEDDNRKSS